MCVWKYLFEIAVAIGVARIGWNYVLFLERKFKSMPEDEEEFDIYE